MVTPAGGHGRACRPLTAAIAAGRWGAARRTRLDGRDDQRAGRAVDAERRRQAAAVLPSRCYAVGIDIQGLVPGLDPVALSARFFAPEEAGYVAAGGDASTRAERFARLWARKEAVVKAAGGRLWPNLGIAVHGRDVVSCAEPAGSYRVTDVPAPAGFRAAVALTGAAPFAMSATCWPGVVPALAS